MNENERIVCEFLRKVAPSREWRYLGEVDHYWIGELCDELNKQLKAENAELRKFASELFRHWSSGPSRGCMLCEHDGKDCYCDCYYEEEAKRLGIEAD